MKMPLNPACFIPDRRGSRRWRHPRSWGERFFCSAACTARRLNLAACYLQLPAAKPYRDLVRAVLSACLAYLVGVGALATHPDVIGVEPGDVRHSGNQHAVAINVDVVRSSSIPREVHRLVSLHLVAARSESDLPRCRSRRRCWRRSGCRCRRRCWCWCWATARRLDLNRHGRAGLKVTYCRVHTLRRLARVKPEIIQRAPANRIGVLILRKCFGVPCYRATGLSNSPRLAAITLVVKRPVICPTRLLRRPMKADVTDVGSGA